MRRKVSVLGVAAATLLLGIVAVEGAASATTISLLLPQGTAFSILGRSCGGIQEQAFATGFDATSGYPTGDVYLKTTCSAGGRGGHSTTYTAWAGVMWDFTGAVISAVGLSMAPTVDPTFSAFDAHGNEVYNASNHAFLTLAPGFVPTPRVTGVSPTFGPASGGTSVSITGTGFTGATAVDFGGTAAASITVNGDTSITAVSPVSGAGTVDVTVTTAGGTDATSASDQFTFFAIPVVSSLSPNSGPIDGGTLVTITGANFTGATAVFFGDAPAGFVVNDDTSITAVSPGEGSPDNVDVTVTSPGGTSAISAADQFTYTTATTTSTIPSSTTTTLPPLCAATPAPGCRLAGAGASSVRLKEDADATKDQFKWKWAKGAATVVTDFKDPVGGSATYRVCIYDGSANPQPLMEMDVPPGGTCGTKPCWKASGTTGFSFTDRVGTTTGLTIMKLKAGGAGTAQVQAAGKGANLPMPTLGLTLPVTLQLLIEDVSATACWQTTFTAAKTNDAAQFSAKGP
jgi:hypothetical protein